MGTRPQIEGVIRCNALARCFERPNLYVSMFRFWIWVRCLLVFRVRCLDRSFAGCFRFAEFCWFRVFGFAGSGSLSMEGRGHALTREIVASWVDFKAGDRRAKKGRASVSGAPSFVGGMWTEAKPIPAAKCRRHLRSRAADRAGRDRPSHRARRRVAGRPD
jgi:hypothetical protein